MVVFCSSSIASCGAGERPRPRYALRPLLATIRERQGRIDEIEEYEAKYYADRATAKPVAVEPLTPALTS